MKNPHTEFVETEWAPDKKRSDYNKPYSPAEQCMLPMNFSKWIKTFYVLLISIGAVTHFIPGGSPLAICAGITVKKSDFSSQVAD